MLAQWDLLFTPDVKIDATAAGAKVFELCEYAELMRGKDLLGGTAGLGLSFNAWQHIEGHATVSIDGDTAHSITPHLHMHASRDGSSNTFAVGYWHDDWVRTPAGWRISFRRVEHLFFQAFPTVKTPQMVSGVDPVRRLRARPPICWRCHGRPSTATRSEGSAIMVFGSSGTDATTSAPHALADPDTPFAVVDAQRARRNSARLQARVDRLGVTLRPHVKTAKSPDVAALMHEATPCPIAVSTLAEAEAFADSGYTDITYAVGIDPHKIPRVLDLQRRGVTVHMLVDSTHQASTIAEASHRTQTALPTRIEIFAYQLDEVPERASIRRITRPSRRRSRTRRGRRPGGRSSERAHRPR